MAAPAKIGLIEAGGTKCLCAVSHGGEISETVRIETTTPDETLEKIRACFHEHGQLDRLALATFGPVHLEERHPDFGTLTTTPKPGWSGLNWCTALAGLSLSPLRIVTDVEAAALGEFLYGAGQGVFSLMYVTVGTGIGAALVRDGRIDRGAQHMEAGHISLRLHPADRDFTGTCPFHGNCLEGLAAGPAVAARTGRPAEALPPDHPVWEQVAFYLGQLCVTLSLIAAPQRIVLGGGLMEVDGLLDRIRREFVNLLGGYHPGAELPREDMIVPASLKGSSAFVGLRHLAGE